MKVLLLVALLNIFIGLVKPITRFYYTDLGIVVQVYNDTLTNVQIITNDEESILNNTIKSDQLNRNIQQINQLWYQQKDSSFYLLPFSLNTFKRTIIFNYYDSNMVLKGTGGISNYIKAKLNQILIGEVQSNQAQLLMQISTIKQFKIINNNQQDDFQVSFKLSNTVQFPYPDKIFDFMIDGQKMAYSQCFKQVLYNNLVVFNQIFQQSDIPISFQKMQLVFNQYQFQQFTIKIIFGSDMIQFDNFNQHFSTQFLMSISLNATVNPSSQFNQIYNQIYFNIDQTVFFQCSIKQIILPPLLQSQYTNQLPSLIITNSQNSNTTLMSTDYNNGIISLQQTQVFQQFKYQAYYSIIITPFNDVVGQNMNLTATFNCPQDVQVSKNITIYQSEFPNANQTITQIQFNNSGIKNLTISIQIPRVNVLNTSLYLQLPQEVDYQQQTQQSIIVQGISFSQFNWNEQIIYFGQTNFSSNVISFQILNVQLKNSSNQTSFKINKIMAKCIFNQTFVFYVDSNTNQTTQIIQPTKVPITLIQINNFNQTTVNSLSIPENRQSVQSQLAFSFSILQFQDSCSWLIVSLPLEFTLNFMQQSVFNFQDCYGNTYSYQNGSPLSNQSPIGYTDSNQCIYISCLNLRILSQANQSNQCLNNTVIIQQVRSPDLPIKTWSLDFFVANSNSSMQSNNNPPIQFNRSLDLQNNSLPYFFIPTEISTYQGINITNFDLSQFSSQISSNYQGDVFDFQMILAFPIYFWDQHLISVQVPFKILGNNSLSCQPSTNVICSILNIKGLDFTNVQIQIINQMKPNTQIILNLQEVAVSQLNQTQNMTISVLLSNRIINTLNKTIDALKSLTFQQWITFQKDKQLEVSNTLLGFQRVNYTFAIQSLQLPKNLNSNYYLSLTLDPNIQFNTTEVYCSQLILTTDSSGVNQVKEISLNCIYNFFNQFLIAIQSISVSQPFQLRISGLRNPSGIVEQNEQNVAQTYNFQLIWSTQQGNSFKNVWVIQSVSLPITSKYTCSPNCQACASNYAACTACAPGYLKSQYNHHAVLACLPTCSPQYVAYNGTCLACQLKDPQCLSCSPSNLTQCSSCNQGYTLVPEFNGCVDSHLLQTARSRLLDYSLSTNLADNIDTTHPDDAQKSDKAQSLTRMTEESSSAKADQREGGESSSNTGSKVMGQLQDTVGALKGGGAIFIWIVLAALAVSVSQSVLRYTYNKLKGKSHSNGSSSGMRRSSSGSRSSSSGSSSAGRNASGKEHKGVREREKELRGQRIDCLMLFLLSVAEAIQMPYTLLWGFSVSGGDFESPVLQTLLGACALSTLLWIFDAYLLGSILANSENTPKTSCLLNPLPSSKREGCLSFLIVPARLAFCLIPKSVSLTLTNIFSVEGWFRYPYGEDVERATIVLTNFRKVLSSQIKSNVSGLCSLVSFLILQYPEVLSSYVQIYDLIIFDIVMTILCLTNIRNVDKLISTLNQIQESEGEL
uniref:MTA5p n=2 Tax=Tetrahymena thermophila TaxID=5911 RepID=M1KJA1_TETTH|nr:MTA5p [Tetrahymena thermophila]